MILPLELYLTDALIFVTACPFVVQIGAWYEVNITACIYEAPLSFLSEKEAFFCRQFS